MTKTQDLTALIDGLREEFPTATEFDLGSLVVVYNGNQLRCGSDFTELAGGFRLHFIPKTDDTLQVQFEAWGDADQYPVVVASGVEPGF